jgi:regulatory protein
VAAKSCHERALGLLAVRQRSRREIQTRLLGAGFEAEEVDEVLERLGRVGLIDDEAFARAVAAYQFGSRRAGRRAVTSALLAKGVAPDLVASVVQEAVGDEESRARDLATAKVVRMGALDPAKAFGRITSLLMRRGYAPDVARSAARYALQADGVGE